MTLNGTHSVKVAPPVNDTGGRKVVEFVLDSGELVWVSPLSPYTHIAIQNKWEEVYPYPDPTPYERVLDDTVALLPGTVVPAIENPDYKKLVTEVENKRREGILLDIMLICCEFPDGQEAVIDRHEYQLGQLQRMHIPLPSDAWEATLLHGVLASEHDRLNILQAARSMLKLTEGEVADGMRVFRPEIQRPADSGVPSKS